MKIELRQSGGGLDFWTDTLFTVKVDGVGRAFAANPLQVMDIIEEEMKRCYQLPLKGTI